MKYLLLMFKSLFTCHFWISVIVCGGKKALVIKKDFILS